MVIGEAGDNGITLAGRFAVDLNVIDEKDGVRPQAEIEVRAIIEHAEPDGELT